MLSTHFIRRGYPHKLILEKLKQASKQDRKSLLNKETLKTPNLSHIRKSGTTLDKKDFFCITTHNPRNPDLKGIVTKNWPLLEKTKTTRPFMDARLVFGNRRNKNIANFLVRASTSQKPLHKQKTITKHPCKVPTKCRYCPLLNKSGTIISKTHCKPFPAKTEINCQSANLIYCITCSKCKIQYVGQTKNRIIDRFNSHHFDIMHNADTTVARHFTKRHANVKESWKKLEISIISFIHAHPDSKNGKIHRDIMERKWMHRLGTILPQGLNLLD